MNTLYREVLTSKSVNETLMCDHSNENYRAMLSNGTVCPLKVCKLNFGNIFSSCVLVTLAQIRAHSEYFVPGHSKRVTWSEKYCFRNP